ncbi:MAG: acyl-CoA carboxylase subunit beta, partial [Cyclonatronaceae bacterium]
MTENAQSYQELMEALLARESLIRQGGGAKRIEKEHKKGKMTARERIGALIDADSEFQEIGLWAGYEMYEEVGGCPAGGVI